MALPLVAIPAGVYWLLGGAALGVGSTLVVSDTVKKAAKYTLYVAAAYGAIKYGPTIVKAVRS